MSRTDCPSLDTLSDFVLGKLSISELGTVAEHLDVCPECEQTTEELDGMADAVVSELRRIPGSDPGASGGATLAAWPPRVAGMPSATEDWGEFRIVREIGRGGMGVVCEAYQGSLNRHVALKFLPEHGNLSRFRREAQAAGRLHHTHIVPVFGVGEHQGRHFYVMQYITGRGLDVVLKERAASASGSGSDRSPGRAGAREAARIGAQVAGALAYAHGQGVIHRDIKPSNLLLDDEGTVWVTDFGLAKIVDQQDLTGTGDFLGTLRYMPPEAFEGRYDARGDIYALGLTLYELLALRKAYEETDRARLTRLITAGDPPARLRDLNREVPRDLETVIHKAIERDPAHRYQTAAALAEDLERFIADRPIRSRRIGEAERFARWCRRNKAVATLLAALVMVFFAGFAGVTIQWRRANAEAARANKTALAESQLRVRAQAEIAARDLDKGFELAWKDDVDYGLLWMAEALAEVPAEQPEVARIARTNLAGWDGQVFRRRAILEHGASALGVRFRPDGRAILTHAEEKVARLWDTATGRELVPPLNHPDNLTCIAFSPDGRLAATGCVDGKVRIWDAVTGRPVGPTLAPGRKPDIWGIARVEFSPDGRLLWSIDFHQTTSLWEVETGRPIDLPKEADTGRLASIAPDRYRQLLNFDTVNRIAPFSPDGHRLLLLDPENGQVRICDIATRTLAGPPIRAEGFAWFCYSPDGSLIGTGDRARMARIWNASTGQAVAAFPPAGDGFHGATFSPDGRLLLTFTNRTAQTWDIVNRRPVGASLRHDSRIHVGAFSPDGRLILTASEDRLTRIWDVATGMPVGSPLRHRREVWDASFSPDGRLVVTASLDSTVQLWDIGQVDPTPIDGIPFRAYPVGDADPGSGNGDWWRASVNRDGSRAVRGGRVPRLIETETGRPIGRPMIHRWPLIWRVIFSPDGRRVATTSQDAGREKGGSLWTTCQVWDAATGRPVSPLLPHSSYVLALAFSPDGKVLATGDYGGAVHLWDVGTGTMIGKPFEVGSEVFSMAFSPDGRLLAAGTPHQAMLWELGSGRALADPVRFKDAVLFLSFRPDGMDLAAGSKDSSVRLIGTDTGRVRAELDPDGQLLGVAFSPDGRLILTWSRNGTGNDARLWDARTGKPTSPPLTHRGDLDKTPPVFNPDGTSFACGYNDGSVRIWDVALARPIGVVRGLRNECRALAFRPGGRSLVAVDDRGEVRSWPVPEPAAGPIEGLVRRVQLLTNLEFDSGKTPAPLKPEAWQRLRAEVGDAPPMSGATDETGWHETNARDSEALGDSFGARWHLDRLIAARPDDGWLHARRARAWLWAGKVPEAQADLNQALELGPRDQILDWLEDRSQVDPPAVALHLLDRVIAVRGDWRTYALRAEVHAALGRTADREADLECAIERGPDIPFLSRIADERSRAGRWAEAARLFDRAIAMGTVPYEVWLQAATAHLEIDDEDGFRRVCQLLRDRNAAPIFEPYVSLTLAGVVTLGPGGIGGDGRALGWIEPLPAAMDSARKPLKRGILRALGAILCRVGRYREAIARLEKAIALGEGEIAPDEALFLAMAHFHAGDHARARALLAAPWRDEPDGPSAEDWWAARGRRLVRREALRLILDPPFPGDVFAH
jgi:WD40 repeat protein/tetratricopeptide (TPR) repeat protein